ncbi:hypothetical protein [Paenibacillus sp. P46E]|uniref:hypothetical protein n=1 Tax=Paenibacillus sp. P46E TaxID=1349436 RepID=UPI00093C7121|nr:hypothetical protein [Paenibacillus sp. P46E]OKP95078.1 hypothetical protein A3849_27745 [Paenibacillus sp. P46E]
MTKTPRDWQNDMEMCEAQEGEQWFNNGNRLEEYDRLTEEGCRPIAEFEREGEAVFAAECREALPYWLQKAKTLKETIEMAMNEYHLWQSGDSAAPMMYGILEQAMSTLYPDTPAPSPDYIDVKFPRAINESWAFIKGDGSFTGPQLKQWTNDLGPDLSQQILRVLIQTIWADYGGKATQVDTPEIIARHIDEWHEDFGDVLWWEFPVCEPPYCGTPIDVDWPGYHTHWTPLTIPAAPAPKEGTPDASVD